MRSWKRIAKHLMAGMLAVAGCGDDEVVIVTRSADVAVVTNVMSGTSAVLFAAADPFVPGVAPATITPEQAAATAATNVNTYYLGNCATASASGASVNYQLNDCRGPLGIVGISGNYTASYASVANGMQITISSSNITIGGASAAINATALYTQTGAERSLAFTDRSTASGNGNDWVLNRTGTLAWSQGQSCVTENSAGTLTVNGNAVRLEATNVVRCANQCVVSGTQALSASDGTSSTLTFSGSATPVLVVSTGSSSQTVSLACAPGAVSSSSSSGAVAPPPQR